MANAVGTSGEGARASLELILVARAQAGDSEAFEALLRPRLDRLLRLAYSIAGNESDAHDAVQESCLRAWRDMPRLRDAARFEAWLWRIVVNACRSGLRGKRRTSVREIAVDQVSGDHELTDPGRPMGEALSAIDAIRRAFGRLDTNKRAILVLHHVDHRSILDIADLLGIPEGTAKWRLHAARKALERALEKER